MIRPIIVANWKMNKTVGESLDFVSRLKKLVIGMNDRQVVIAPSFTALYPVGAALKDSAIGLAAQNLSDNRDGAYTGEVSAQDARRCGLYVCDCRSFGTPGLFGESNDFIHAKIGMALEYGMQPIFCIGETLQEREAGRTFDVIEKQIKEGLNQIATSDIEQMVIAYEPVWAIGTGKTATPEQAGEAHAFIRHLIGKRYAGRIRPAGFL